MGNKITRTEKIDQLKLYFKNDTLKGIDRRIAARQAKDEASLRAKFGFPPGPSKEVLALSALYQERAFSCPMLAIVAPAIADPYKAARAYCMLKPSDMRAPPEFVASRQYTTVTVREVVDDQAEGEAAYKHVRFSEPKSA